MILDLHDCAMITESQVKFHISTSKLIVEATPEIIQVKLTIHFDLYPKRLRRVFALISIYTTIPNLSGN